MRYRDVMGHATSKPADGRIHNDAAPLAVFSAYSTGYSRAERDRALRQRLHQGSRNHNTRSRVLSGDPSSILNQLRRLRSGNSAATRPQSMPRSGNITPDAAGCNFSLLRRGTFTRPVMDTLSPPIATIACSETFFSNDTRSPSQDVDGLPVHDGALPKVRWSFAAWWVLYDLSRNLGDSCREKYNRRQSSTGRSPAEQ